MDEKERDMGNKRKGKRNCLAVMCYNIALDAITNMHAHKQSWTSCLTGVDKHMHVIGDAIDKAVLGNAKLARQPSIDVVLHERQEITNVEHFLGDGCEQSMHTHTRQPRENNEYADYFLFRRQEHDYNMQSYNLYTTRLWSLLTSKKNNEKKRSKTSVQPLALPEVKRKHAKENKLLKHAWLNIISQH